MRSLPTALHLARAPALGCVGLVLALLAAAALDPAGEPASGEPASVEPAPVAPRDSLPRGGAVDARINPTASRIDYTGSAPAHDWTGTSRRVRGRVRLDTADPAQTAVMVTVPAATFDSGNSTRDAKMRRVLETERYPDVRFEAEAIRVEAWTRTEAGYAGRWRVAGPLRFHGRTHRVEADVRLRLGADSLTADVRFPVSLTRFEVDRPRLLFIPIADTIRIDARLRAAVEARTPPADTTAASPPPNGATRPQG
jgi:polyisoprenoid-binding protein YceI